MYLFSRETAQQTVDMSLYIVGLCLYCISHWPRNVHSTILIRVMRDTACRGN